MVSGTIYVFIGCFILITQLSYLKNVTTNFTNRVKDYSLLYVFGMFSLFLELYNKLTSIDGTGDHKYYYSTVKPDVEEEMKVDISKDLKNDTSKEMIK